MGHNKSINFHHIVCTVFLCCYTLCFSSKCIDLVISNVFPSQDHGYAEELIQHFQTALGLKCARIEMFTELPIIYSTFKLGKSKLLNLLWSQLNIPKDLRAAEQASLLKDIVYLVDNFEEFYLDHQLLNDLLLISQVHVCTKELFVFYCVLPR